jgi:hypothetical protein
MTLLNVLHAYSVLCAIVTVLWVAYGLKEYRREARRKARLSGCLVFCRIGPSQLTWHLLLSSGEEIGPFSTSQDAESYKAGY